MSVVNALKTKHREIRETSPPDLNLRVHRALSWMSRADELSEDVDAAFIFYWIAFNAAYAQDIGRPIAGARSDFMEYFQQLEALDRQKMIFRAIWNEFPGPIRLLLTNKFTFSPFWKYYNGEAEFDNWERRFENAILTMRTAYRQKNTPKLLSLVFDRLYVLRNQLVHGGATWNSKINREQVKDGHKILSTLVPIFVDIMMSNSEIDWGNPYYPVVPS